MGSPKLIKIWIAQGIVLWKWLTDVLFECHQNARSGEENNRQLVMEAKYGGIDLDVIELEKAF